MQRRRRQSPKRLGWTRRQKPYDSLDPFNKMLAVTETVAHLRLLVATGALVIEGGDVPTYRPSRGLAAPAGGA